VADLEILRLEIDPTTELAREVPYHLTINADMRHRIGAPLLSANDLLDVAYYYASNSSTDPLSNVFDGMTATFGSGDFPWDMAQNRSLVFEADVKVPFEICLDVTTICIIVKNGEEYIDTKPNGTTVCLDLLPYLICKPGEEYIICNLYAITQT
jgi:hypothetical protein